MNDTRLRSIPDEDLEQLAMQAGEIQAEQASGFGYDYRTMTWASQVAGEWTRRRLLPTMAQARADYRARFPRRTWGVLSKRLNLYTAANPPF